MLNIKIRLEDPMLSLISHSSFLYSSLLLFSQKFYFGKHIDYTPQLAFPGPYSRTALEMSPSWYFSQIRSESSFWNWLKPYVLSRAARGNHYKGLSGPLNNDLFWSSGENEWMNWKTYLRTHGPLLLSHFQIPTLNSQCICYFLAIRIPPQICLSMVNHRMLW